VAPKEHEDRDPLFERDVELSALGGALLLGVVRARERRDDEVPAERSWRKSACPADPSDRLRTRHSEPENTEATSVGYRRRELGRRGPPEADVHDRDVDPEDVAERRAKRHEAEA